MDARLSNCHAGCHIELVLEPLGLSFRDLFVDFAALVDRGDSDPSRPGCYKGLGTRDQGGT